MQTTLSTQKDELLQNNILETLIHTTTVGILVEDKNRRILQINQAFLNLFGIPNKPEELVGMDCAPFAVNFNSFFLMDPPFDQLIDSLLVRHEKVERIELTTVTNQTFLLSFFPVVFSDNQNGLVWQYEDITEIKKVEKQLLESRKNYETLIDSINEIFFQLNQEGLVVYISKGFENFTGLKVMDVLGIHYHKLPFLNFTEPGKHFFQDLRLDQHKTIQISQRVSLKGKADKWVLIKAKGVFENGGFSGVVGTATDISKEMEISEQLQETNNFLDIMSSAQNLYIRTNSAYQSLTFLLENLIRITQSSFGFIGEIIIDEVGEPYLKSHATSNIAWNAETLDLYQKNVATGMEFRNTDTIFGKVVKTGKLYISNSPSTDPNASGTPPGHPELTCFAGIPIYNGNKLIGMIGLANKKGGYHASQFNSLQPVLSTTAAILEAFRNYQITQNAKQKISENERNLVSILTSFEDEVLEVNEKLQVLNKWSKSKVITSQYEHLLSEYLFTDFLPEENREEALEVVSRVFQTGIPQIIDYEWRDSVGNVKWYSAKINLVDLRGTKHVSVLVQDISLRKRAEMELLHALNREKELNQLKTKFVSMTSHEFRTPLTGIQTSADLIEHFVNAPESRRDFGKINHYLAVIKGEINRVTELMNDVLLLGKLESGKTHTDFTLISIQETMDELRVKFSKTYLTAQIIYKESPSNLVVKSDKRLMEHILDNIIHNAIKYSGENPIVEVECFQQENHMVLSVKDHGIGIPADEIKYVFESFYRAKNADSLQGTGLGLVIVKNMVGILGGNISLQSELGIGTTVNIEFYNVIE
jgi:PAS domain S-box-containing protein